MSIPALLLINLAFAFTGRDAIFAKPQCRAEKLGMALVAVLVVLCCRLHSMSGIRLGGAGVHAVSSLVILTCYWARALAIFVAGPGEDRPGV